MAEVQKEKKGSEQTEGGKEKQSPVVGIVKKTPPFIKLKTEHYAMALVKAQGKISLAAQLLGVTQQAVSKRIKRSRKLQEVRQQIWAEWIDLLELEEYQAARKGPQKMECRHFILTHHREAKRRGWGKRVEVGGPGGGPVPVKMYDFDASKYPKPLLEASASVAVYGEADSDDGREGEDDDVG